jgi:hypothetical protein
MNREPEKSSKQPRNLFKGGGAEYRILDGMISLEYDIQWGSFSFKSNCRQLRFTRLPTTSSIANFENGNDEVGSRFVLNDLIFEVLGHLRVSIFTDASLSRRKACGMTATVLHAVTVNIFDEWLVDWNGDLDSVFDLCVVIPNDEVEALKTPSPLNGLHLHHGKL